MQHPDEGIIHAWLDGALPPDEADSIARHVAECADCASVVADARGLIAGASRIVSSLDVVPGNVIPSRAKAAPTGGSVWRRLRLTPARAAIAAAVLVAATSLLTVNRTPTYDLSKAKASEGIPIIRSADTAAPASAPAPAVSTTASAKPSAKRMPVSSIPPVSEPPAPKVEIAPLRAAAPAAPPQAADRAAAENARQAVDAEAVSRAAMRQNAAQSMELRSAAGAPGFASRVGAADSPEGCYRLSFDTTSWLRMLPQQFALAKDSTSGKNFVRGVTPNGTLDSIIASAEWSASPSGAVLVVSHKVSSQPVSLRFSSASSRATAQLASDVRVVPVQRTVCRP